MLLLSKILSLLVYPLSLCLLLLVLAILLRMRGARGRASNVTLLATAWLYFCATEWGAAALLTPLEAAYPAFANEELPTAEAIVVLGGAVTGESRFGQGGDFNQAADRLWRAATLYQSEKAPLLVLSGGTTRPGGLPESQLMAQKLSALGIPDAVLMQEAETRKWQTIGGILLVEYFEAVRGDAGLTQPADRSTLIIAPQLSNSPQ